MRSAARSRPRSRPRSCGCSESIPAHRRQRDRRVQPAGASGVRHADPAHRGDPLRVLRCGNRTFNNSNGCGTGLTWISSNSICDNSAGSSQSCNSAAWASLDGTNWTNNQHQWAITNAGLADAGVQCHGACRHQYLPRQRDGPADLQPAAQYLRRQPDLDPEPVETSRRQWPGSPPGVSRLVGWLGGRCHDGGQHLPAGGHDRRAQIATLQQVRGDPDLRPEQRLRHLAEHGSAGGGLLRHVRTPASARCSATSVCDTLGTVATLDPVPRSAVATRLRLVR